MRTGAYIPENWRDYELLDSGEEMKLERWGQYVVARPDPRALWKKSDPDLWKRADAQYISGENKDQEEGEWKFRTKPPTPWEIGYGNIRFSLRPTSFKHTGVFPEQATNWEWISGKITSRKQAHPEQQVKILNLFAYTGGATMAAALAGAHVTHVDSSKPAMIWASENARLTGIGKDQIRWIQDDALKFGQREIRRGVKYDGILMDPPRFGRGAGGEIWKLEQGLPELIHTTAALLSETPLFFLVNAYTADLSAIALGNVLSDYFPTVNNEYGELGLAETAGKRTLPAGIFARWSVTSE